MTRTGRFSFIALLTIAIATALALSACSSSPKGPKGKHDYNWLEPIPKKAPHTLFHNMKQMTYAGKRTGEGYFSKDGKLMIFQSEREAGNPFYQMYVKDLKTDKTWKVSPGYGKTTCGWIHPSNKKVMYSSTHSDIEAKKKQKDELDFRASGKKKRYAWDYDANYEIYEAKINGKRPRNLTKAKGYDAEGSYSPDGKWIAFASNRHAYTDKLNEAERAIFQRDASYMMDIYLMRSNGKEVKRLTTTKGYDGGPFFSPDGKKIIWRRFNESGQAAEIYTMNLDGTEQTQITRLDAMSWAPYYHPSGDYIIFTTNRHGYKNFELYIVDAAGSKEPVRVSFLEGFDGLPVFNPEGNKLVWSRATSSSGGQLYTADWDDLLARKLLKLPAPAPKVSQLSSKVFSKDIQSLVTYFAAPEMRGRNTGSAEEKIYSATLAKMFNKMGLAPAGDNGSYLQKFDFVSGVELGKENALTISGKSSGKPELNKDWRPIGGTNNEITAGPVVFAGYGIIAPQDGKHQVYDSYEKLNVKGKWVMVYRYVPEDVKGAYKVHLNRYSRLPFKAMLARNRGAKGLIVVSGPNSGVKKQLIPLSTTASTLSQSIPVISVSDSLAKKILSPTGKDLATLQKQLDKGEIIAGFDLKGVHVAARVSINTVKSHAYNVLAKLKVPGARRTVVVGAHGDHLGVGKTEGSLISKKKYNTDIHYGADDNASGMAGVVELAHHFSTNKKGLKQNILFAIWSGEEKGTLGSLHFTKGTSASTNTKKTKSIYPRYSSYVNMDMIGRLDKEVAVQGLSSSNKWEKLIEKLGPKLTVPIKLGQDPYLPTDSMPFYLAGVPTINFFTGSHEDYHTPGDTADKVNYGGVEKIVKTVELVTRELASNKSAMPYQKVKQEGSHGSRRGFRIYLGTIPDYANKKVKGVKLSGVVEGGPAAKAGLKGGDIIIEFAGVKIQNIYDYVYALEALKPGKKEAIIVMRMGDRVQLQVTPASKQ